jgi:hypothetical protein
MRDAKDDYDRIMSIMNDLRLEGIQLEFWKRGREVEVGLLTNASPRALKAGVGEAYERAIANIDADIAGIVERIVRFRESIDELKPRLIAEMSKFILLKTDGRRFCWNKNMLARLLETQVREGKGPYDPVTRNPILPHDYTKITGLRLDEAQAKRVRDRTIFPSGRPHTEFVDIAAGLERNLEHRIRRRPDYDAFKGSEDYEPPLPAGAPLPKKPRQDGGPAPAAR